MHRCPTRLPPWQRRFSSSLLLHLSTLVALTFWQFLRNAGRRNLLPSTAGKNVRRTETAMSEDGEERKFSRKRAQEYRVHSIDIKTGFPAGPSLVINVESFMNSIGLFPSRVDRIRYAGEKSDKRFRWRGVFE